MPFEIKFDTVPMGYAAGAAKGPGTVPVRQSEFISSEDGPEFIQRLEGLPDSIIRRLPPELGILPSQVDHLLAVIRGDCTATVYVNEVRFEAILRPTRAIKQGDLIAKDDIADVVGMEAVGIAVPEDAGLALILSAGWRKGFFYDLCPLRLGAPPRSFDVTVAFGQVYSRLLFQERFRVSEGEWAVLFQSKWFLFAGLSNGTIERMLKHLRAGWNLDESTATVSEEVKQRLPSYLAFWKEHPAFGGHVEILERAVERFLACDYISCTGLLYPRIEGVMRSYHATTHSQDKPTQAALCTSAVSANIQRPACLLLPHMFERYMKEVYFASFQPGDANIDVSRNSVGHGVASSEAFSQKAATIAILVIQQLCYSFGAVVQKAGT